MLIVTAQQFHQNSSKCLLLLFFINIVALQRAFGNGNENLLDIARELVESSQILFDEIWLRKCENVDLDIELLKQNIVGTVCSANFELAMADNNSRKLVKNFCAQLKNGKNLEAEMLKEEAKIEQFTSQKFDKKQIIEKIYEISFLNAKNKANFAILMDKFFTEFGRINALLIKYILASDAPHTPSAFADLQHKSMPNIWGRRRKKRMDDGTDDDMDDGTDDGTDDDMDNSTDDGTDDDIVVPNYDQAQMRRMADQIWRERLRNRMRIELVGLCVFFVICLMVFVALRNFNTTMWDGLLITMALNLSLPLIKRICAIVIAKPEPILPLVEPEDNDDNNN